MPGIAGIFSRDVTMQDAMAQVVSSRLIKPGKRPIPLSSGQASECRLFESMLCVSCIASQAGSPARRPRGSCRVPPSRFPSRWRIERVRRPPSEPRPQPMPLPGFVSGAAAPSRLHEVIPSALYNEARSMNPGLRSRAGCPPAATAKRSSHGCRLKGPPQACPQALSGRSRRRRPARRSARSEAAPHRPAHRHGHAVSGKET